MAIEMRTENAESAFSVDTVLTSRAYTFAPGWGPAVLTDRGTAMCRLSEFIDALEAVDTADTAWFAYPLSELLVTACEAETALR